jgi:murein DD-endopeptidase MepM/ murein hydrolase activator NlpD
MNNSNQALSTLALILTMNLVLGCSTEEAAVPADETAPAVVPSVAAGEQPDVEGAAAAIDSTEPVVIVEDVKTDEAPVQVEQQEDEQGEQGVNIVNETAPRVYDEGCPADKQEWDMVPPVFKHIGVDLAPVDHATGWAGAFNFNDLAGVGGSTNFFEPFAHQQPYGGYAPISDWIFGTAPGTNIYSPLDGIVVYVAHNSNWDDWEVIINPRNCNKSFYVVTVDHIVDVTVAIGDRVVAGQVIGKKGADHYNGQYEGNARTFEITVSDANGNAYCPLLFFPEQERIEAAAKLEQLMIDIESYQSPNPHIQFNYLGENFDESRWAGNGELIGCYAESNTFESVPVSQ